MDIRHLKTLIAIADYGTFGAAGEAVFLSQSAVSQQVRIIEEFLGVKIFDRTVRPPALTAQGSMVLEGARKIIKEYDRITRKMSGDGLSGRLVIGAIRASIKGALPKALAILRHRYPQLRIQLHTGSSSDLIAKVEHGSLDAAIAPKDTKLTDTLDWLPYTSEPRKKLCRHCTANFLSSAGHRTSEPIRSGFWEKRQRIKTYFPYF